LFDAHNILAAAQDELMQAHADFAPTSYDCWRDSPRGEALTRSVERRRRVTTAASMTMGITSI
jgi:hypothetical protein